MPKLRVWGRPAMRHSLVGLIVAGMALTGCDEDAASPKAGGLPGKTPMVGTETCQREVNSDEYLDDGTEVMRETFTCDLEMSDPRASGLYVWHVETTFLEPEDVTSAFTGEGTLTNDEGSWTGTGEGVLDFGDELTNYGEETYEGQGAYAGLTLHLLFAGSNTEISYAGWLEGSQ